MSSLHGKVVLITGAASGIGRATAQAFAEADSTLILLDRDAAGLEALRSELASRDVIARARVTDVGDAEQVDAAHDEAVDACGRIDIAVNNAGVTFPTALTHVTTEDEFDRVIRANLKGVWLGMRAQLRHMDAAGSGAIVNMASIAGIVGAPGGGPYAASKQGIIGLTRSAAMEYARRGIRINAVAPGMVETPMLEEFERLADDPSIPEAVRNSHPVGRCARPEEIAAAVLWLAGDGASFATGSVLTVDGGLTVN
ncbi:MAG: SDR family NAD(P)-dependent oxidoreductase [Solirubrobacteraceae bacterium]